MVAKLIECGSASLSQGSVSEKAHLEKKTVPR